MKMLTQERRRWAARLRLLQGVGDVGGDGEVALAVDDGGVDEGDALDGGDVDAVREVVVEERHDGISAQRLDDVVKQRDVDGAHVRVGHSDGRVEVGQISVDPAVLDSNLGAGGELDVESEHIDGAARGREDGHDDLAGAGYLNALGREGGGGRRGGDDLRLHLHVGVLLRQLRQDILK